MNYVGYYLLFGLAFSISVDLASSWLNTKSRFDNWEKLVIILIWPFSIVLLIKGFIKILIKHYKRK
jgi:hypothetical protein